jgi:putative DNA primase/helicase
MINFDAFPLALRTVRRWVGARLEPRDGRQTKVPYCAADPTRKASSTDPNTWSDFATAVSAIKDGRLPLLGFVLGDGFVGVDLDKCRDAVTGVIEQWAQQIIDLLATYTEISVSGTGVHMICRGELPRGGRRKGQIEMYDSARFFVMTSSVVDAVTGATDLVDCTEQLASLHAQVFGGAEVAVASSSTGLSGEIGDDDLLARIRASKQGDKFEQLWKGDTSLHQGDDSAADQALCNILAFWTQRNRAQIDRLFRASGLFRQKWERADYREATLSRACAIKEVYEPSALVVDPSAPLTIARTFVERHLTIDGVRAVQFQQGVFYAFDPDTSAYAEQEADTVRASLYRFLEGTKCWQDDRLEAFKPTKAKVDGVLDALKAVCQLPASKKAPCWLADAPEGLDPVDMLACRNGLLHAPSRTLHPATATFFTLNGLEFAYDAEAPAPIAWEQFLQSVWPDDQESIGTLQEFFGYNLTPDTRFQKIQMIVGPKRSGKGTIARILRRLVGARNACSPTLASFGRDFGKQSLIDKTVAVISDARISGRTDTAVVAETLLSISGEDDQTVERKFLPDWNGKLNVRFLLLTNELPRIGDASGALASRFIVLVMKQSFFGKEDLALFDRLMKEDASILNWALAGRDRLYARGYFVQPKSADEMIEEFNELGSPEATFFNECCVAQPGAEVSQPDLFAAWTQWCERNGHKHHGTTATFGRSMRATASWLTSVNRRDGEARVRYWVGLALLDTGGDEKKDLPF